MRGSLEEILGVAFPSKPEALNGAYRFPEDPTLLSTDEVGKWMFSLTAWNGYVLRNLAVAELAASEAEIAYDTLLQATLLRVENRRGKTRNQLSLEAMSLNKDIIVAKGKLTEAEAEVHVWGRFHKLYEAQVAVLSREISRRAGESQQWEGRFPRRDE